MTDCAALPSYFNFQIQRNCKTKTDLNSVVRGSAFANACRFNSPFSIISCVFMFDGGRCLKLYDMHTSYLFIIDMG